ncbi:MAG: MFS transporter [Vulcanimicrobiaceae bacterium]|jgi:putative MFS transporter
MALVNAGARLDRLPISGFHYRIMWLIGIGMFFDGFDIYLSASVLGALVASGFSTLHLNATFVSVTFAGLVIGSFATGFLGDRFGRRFTYQFNLALFGLASIAAGFAPTMPVLILIRFFIGIGLGAEIVVGYGTLTEFVPPAVRGKWLGGMAVFVVTALPVATLVGRFVIPTIGWHWMFAIAGVGALIVWYLRKTLPESPRWLESVGRDAEAERVLTAIETEVAAGTPLPPVLATSAAPHVPVSLTSHEMLVRLFVGAVMMIVVNTLLYGFVTWIPTFFVNEGLSVAKSVGFSAVMALGAPVGSAIGAFTADSWGRKRTIIGASLVTILFGAIYPFVHDPALVMLVGFLLVTPIYVMVAVEIGIYVSELFPTEIRMRGAGISNTFGRAATIVTPFLIVWLLQGHGVAGVLAFMIALLIVQIVVVWTLGVEPRKRSLEEIDPDAGMLAVAVQASR